MTKYHLQTESALDAALMREKALEEKVEKQRIEIEFLKAQLSKYFYEPKTFTSGTASTKETE